MSIEKKSICTPAADRIRCPPGTGKDPPIGRVFWGYSTVSAAGVEMAMLPSLSVMMQR